MTRRTVSRMPRMVGFPWRIVGTEVIPSNVAIQFFGNFQYEWHIPDGRGGQRAQGRLATVSAASNSLNKSDQRKIE